MSLVSKLISAAVTVGTAAAVGYGLKKLGEKAVNEFAPPAPEEDTEVLGTADSKIKLKLAEGDWSYTVKEKGIVKEKESFADKCAKHFEFVPLKDGVTQLEFDYTPKGSEKSARTITYNIQVKNGQIIRCDAAGDLEMIER